MKRVNIQTHYSIVVFLPTIVLDSFNATTLCLSWLCWTLDINIERKK